MRYESKLAAGQSIGERYRITGLIGSGGMSHVHLAEDLRLPGKRWAVKESVTSGHDYGDIEAEAELLISLNHRRLPRVADFYRPDEDGYSYLIMDYIEGMTLNRYMELHPGPLPGEQIIRFAEQLLEVLEYLHGHHPPVVYRDLKPSNIMLTKQNELVLIDFGIARSYKRGGHEDTVKLGTVGFAAPEQYDGQSQPVSDLYGLGALLLYMATGGQFCGWQPGMETRLHGRVPNGLIPVIRRLLRHLPEERYPDAASVMLAIAPFYLKEHHAAGYKPLSSDRSGTVVVALLGVSGGLGTTHTSFAVSSRLSRLGPTAWVDYCPDSPVFERIHSMVEIPEQASFGLDGATASFFTWNAVQYWRRPSLGNLNELLEGGYSFIVIDLGTGGYEGALDEFMNSDVPLLIASGADWRLGETLVWLRRNALQPQPKWRVGLPLSGPSAASLLQDALGAGKVFALPLQRDPFHRKGRLGEVLDEVLEDVTTVRLPRKRAGFFHKKSQ